jgi:PadR family transcriptional regulator PadR
LQKKVLNNTHNLLMKTENTKAQMRKGILELCILSILKKTPKYSTDILDHLKDSKLLVVEGTLYPLLTRLKNGGLLDYHWEESSSGPPRKYFTITDDGKTFLADLNQSWDDLSKAVNTLIKKQS